MSRSREEQQAYLLRKTDKNELPLFVQRLIEDKEQVDVTLVGSKVKEYGESFDNNLLSLLENFSCPAANPTDPIVEQTPDLENSVDSRLTKPIEGQLWHNTSCNLIYYYEIVDPFENVGKWTALQSFEEVAGNYGQLQSGGIIPKPVVNGRELPYEECSWIVSPMQYLADIGEMECTTVVTPAEGPIESVVALCRAKHIGSSSWTEYPVNYQIIGIRQNFS